MANIEIKFQQAKEFILDLIFPRECIGCGREGAYLCPNCLNQIELNQPEACALCHRPSPGGQICRQCGQETSLKAIWVATDYNQKIIQDLIHNLKYNYLESTALGLSQILKNYLEFNNRLEQFQLLPAQTVLAPVPLHRQRYLGRGFNQSRLLADNLAGLINIETADILLRAKNTQTQINLNRSERQQNVKGAFELKSNFDINKKVILIDDVVTTGSTLKECADVLATAGFCEIYGLVIAQREDR